MLDISRHIQRIVQFLPVCGLRPCLLADTGDGRVVKPPQVGGGCGVEKSTTGDGTGAPLFQWRTIQESVGPAVDNLRRQGGRLHQIAGYHTDRPCFDACYPFDQPVNIHGLGQAILNGLVNQGMVGYLPVTDDILQTGKLVREHTGDQVLRLHPQQVGLGFFPALETA